MRSLPLALAVTLTIGLSSVTRSQEGKAESGFKGRGVWANPRDAGTTDESVTAFVAQLEKAHINTVVMEVKSAAGICWPSTTFSESVLPAYRSFDMPDALVRECHKRNIKVHAWFFDFAEGADSAVVKRHPEWLALNPEGKPSTSEILRGRPYRLAWMCPARRPGYTDQWLIPIIEEFARRYEVDAIHHDYVRYPGDLAPDTYCYCDYCLKEIPRYAGYLSESFPDRPFFPPIDRPHLEAHWEKSPRVLPGNWNDLTREMKSRFLLQGSFFPGGNRDLDYFFYEYRENAVTAFVRQVYEQVRNTRPGMEFSAAIFKNPVQSGRFIGQDWRRFAPWVHYAMPMDYRSHFPGDFDTHLKLLEETILAQKAWARDYPHLWIGIATSYLFDEEREPLVRLRDMIRNSASAAEVLREYGRIPERVQQFAPGLAGALSGYTGEPATAASALSALDAFFADIPEGYYPPEKLVRTFETVRKTGVEGIVIFSASGIRSSRLWETVGNLFAR